MTSARTTFGSAPGLPLSPAVRAGDFVFVSGQLPWDSSGQIVDGNIETQTRAVMKRLTDILVLAGASLGDIVKVTVWLEDPRDFAGFNKVYQEYFSQNPPARSTVRSELLLDARLEVEAIAYKPV